MTCLQLPHKILDYSCPINGLEDMYEWKTGHQLPGFFLMDLSMMGFLYIRQKNAPTPRMVFWGNGTGRPQHELLGDIIGYRWNFYENQSFSVAWNHVREAIDQGYPVILGLVDMFHLPYYPRFYHRLHIPQHYILLVGYNHDRQEAYVHDNGMVDVQTIPLTDLREAWNVNNPGQGKKNSYCVVEFNSRIAPLEEIARKGLKKKAAHILQPPVSFMGIQGLHKLAADMGNWGRDLSPTLLKRCLNDFVTFTCSIVPLPPHQLLPQPSAINDPHQAVRDRFASELINLSKDFKEPSWNAAAEVFIESGNLIGQLTECIVDQILSNSMDTRKAVTLVKAIGEKEERAFKLLL